MSNARILIVDDEPQIRRFLTSLLEMQGYAAEAVPDGHSALGRVRDWRPEVVLLDLGLPDMDGLDVCRQLRMWTNVPIIVLSVRDREQDKVDALNGGADDYLTKPFGAAELHARIQVALRHAGYVGGMVEPVIAVGAILIDLGARRVTRGGVEVHLTPTEYDILKTLAANRGRVLTHAALLRMVWGQHNQEDAAKLRVFINQIRRKIEEDPVQPAVIVTESGVGYRFQDGVAAQPQA